MTQWDFEPGHSSVAFAVRHLMVTIVRGHYKNIKGTLEFDTADPAHSSVEVSMDAASFSSGEKERDDHLRNPDFLDVEKHPTINFKSVHIEETGYNNYKVTGELTIRGTTRPVTLDAQYFGPVDTPFGNTRIGFLATTRINRHDFGVSWNSPMPERGFVVGSDVEITIDVEAIRAS